MTTKTFKAVIIGAGISGISTAINLLDNNYKDFAIY
jgi:cation diffusion facilitator CzcD-associated flavoprotein CzcO